MTNLRWMFSIMLIGSLFACQSTKTPPAIEQLVARQDSLFTQCYQHRDTQTFEKLVAEFLGAYKSQSTETQQQYAGFLANAYYNLACTYALNGDQPMALKNLKLSIDAGYIDYQHIRSDNDLAALREDPNFRALTEPLRKIGDYRYILAHAGTYDLQDNRKLPKFTYQPATFPKLEELRKTFHLDSIAGNGDEISKIKNLMHWVHNLIPHDGNHGNPLVKNAISMIGVCQREKRGLNCRGLATVLNECYLSMGFKSRFVTCLPKDSLKRDNDCHVINTVYSESLKKWVWMDPTNEAWVMDEQGNLLSIAEVRERLIKDMPLRLNGEANWNGKSTVTADDYLYRYMAKNLYMLESPAVSEFDTETIQPGKEVSYLLLLPVEHYIQSPDKVTSGNNVVYKTNNSALFWELP